LVFRIRLHKEGLLVWKALTWWKKGNQRLENIIQFLNFIELFRRIKSCFKVENKIYHVCYIVFRCLEGEKELKVLDLRGAKSSLYFCYDYPTDGHCQLRWWCIIHLCFFNLFIPIQEWMSDLPSTITSRSSLTLFIYLFIYLFLYINLP